MSEKWGRRLFRTGAALLLLAGLAHSLSLVEKPVPANDTEKQLMALSSSYKFNLLGSARSVDDLMRGFSIAFLLAVVGPGVLDLVLAGERTSLLKRVALVNAIWLISMTTVSLNYFFAAPTFFLSLPLLVFAVAWAILPGSAS